jgi:hypothetical protein
MTVNSCAGDSPGGWLRHWPKWALHPCHLRKERCKRAGVCPWQLLVHSLATQYQSHCLVVDTITQPEHQLFARDTRSACMQSCTQRGTSYCAQPYRAFLIIGTPQQRKTAQHIITSAVDHYERLFSGKLCTLPAICCLYHGSTSMQNVRNDL